MDTSLDNANNPFTNSNGADNNILAPQKTDGLLLNLSENFKHNGASDLSPSGDFYHNSEKANGKRLASEFDDDDDLGPETDVDAVDDVLSPSTVTAKALAEGIVNNNPDGSFNPFVEKHEMETAALEMDLDLQKQQSSEFDGQRSPREETPTPPADAVLDGGLEDNVADSGEESEDEWNYIKGEEANKENINPSQPDCEVAALLEEPDMSQLNPNAAEFVPVSPTRSIPSPACRSLINDPVIAQSPKRANDIDINLPNPQDFEKEVKSRPSDFDSYSNGHDHEGDEKSNSQELMENLLNGKNIDDIPEFQPGSTPTKVPSSEEFHFGPNASPFTPAKLLDQSEAALSTKAVFGDESAVTVDTSFDISTKDNVDFTNKFNKEEDPMSMSFYQDKSEGEDELNKVQLLPENLDDFLNKSQEQIKDDTISNQFVSDEILLNNDERIQTTDLDKVVDDEKELASPVSNEEDLISGTCEAGDSIPKETLPVEVCSRPESKSPQPDLMDELGYTRTEASPKPTEELLKIDSSVPQIFSPELADLSPVPQVQPSEPQIYHEPETNVLSPELELQIESSVVEASSPEPSEELCQISTSPAPSPQPTGDVCLMSKSPEPQQQLIDIVQEPEVASDDMCKLEVEEKKEVSIESPVEDVTSSVKDIASPVVSPVPDQISADQLSFAQEINTAIQATVTVEASSPINDQTLISDQYPISTPQSVTDTESVHTADMNSFLERSGVAELASPMSPSDQPLYKDGVLDPTHPLMTCVYPLPTTDNQAFLQEAVPSPDPQSAYPLPTDIKTETIVPEFAEPAVVSPAEETSTPLEETMTVDKVEEENASVAAPVVVAVAAAAVTAATATTLTTEKKPAKAKTPTVKKTPAKTTTASPTKAAASPTKARSTAIGKTRPPTASKSATTMTSRPPVTKAAPKPKTTSTGPTKAATERKPLTNGDVKVPPKPSLSARKSLESQKTATPKPLTKMSPTKLSVPKATSAKPATTTRTITATAPKPRPITLTKTSTTTSARTATTASSARLTVTVSKITTSPKTTISPKPRPATAPAPAKPRAPLTKTIAKTSVDAEKQNKESANKLTASRTLTSSRNTTTSTTNRTVTSTVRRTEAKTTGATRTNLTKTTTTTTRPGYVAAGKKPAEVTRTAANAKTKVTKVEKPVQNGVSTVVTEQLTTTVNNAVNQNEQPLMKDNSPIDNKLIVETNAAD